MLMIFITSFGKNLMEIGIPYLKMKSKVKAQHILLEKMKKEGHNLDLEDEKLRTRIELEFELPSYESQDVYGTYSEYMEMIIQYGFVVMFAAGMPIAPILALINNFVGKSLPLTSLRNES
jgi:anoctamin-10